MAENTSFPLLTALLQRDTVKTLSMTDLFMVATTLSTFV